MGFPDNSVGKESACNAGDPGLIPGSGRSAGEGTGYPLQYSWASLLAQMVKICLQCRRPGFDPWVGKIPWRRERLPTTVFWPREFHGQAMGSQRVRHNWATFSFTFFPWELALGLTTARGHTAISCHHMGTYSQPQQSGMHTTSFSHHWHQASIVLWQPWTCCKSYHRIMQLVMSWTQLAESTRHHAPSDPEPTFAPLRYIPHD